jgi:hypothetical protein
MTNQEAFKNKFNKTGWEKLWQEIYEMLLKAEPVILL